MTLEEILKDLENYLNENYISKDKIKTKIKEKIKEIESSTENYTFQSVTSEDIRRTIITNLQELLEE